MIFRVDFEPYMGRERFQARGAQIFAAFRLLEFAIYSARRVPCEFILADAQETLQAARGLVPPTVWS